ncbi:MAG: DUF6683 family protein [Armatimonadota bacterium]
MLLCVFASASASRSQDGGAAVDMTGIGIYAMEDAVKESARPTKQTRRNPGAKIGSPSRQQTARETAILTFTPSLERRRRNLTAFAAKLRAQNPQAKVNIQQPIGNGDIISRLNQELVKVGLKPNNIADAYAAWWLNAWLASRGRVDTPPRAQIAAIRAQAVHALLRVPALASASDAAKQELAEDYLVQTAIIGAALEQAKNNPAQLKAIAARIRQDAAIRGLNLDALSLTSKGFEKRR